MAELSKNPLGWELEDFVAAHFVSRGCYVETGVKEQSPDEILELDIVWTDYKNQPGRRRCVEVKSGNWGLSDVFKFFGWTNYLDLEPGLFVYSNRPRARSDSTVEHVAKKVGIQMLNVPELKDAENVFAALGLPKPPWDDLPNIWRYSFWAQRRLLQSLGEAIEQGVYRESAITAKDYHKLINNAVFFMPDVRDRVSNLLSDHFDHQHLAATAAHERETGETVYKNPPQTNTFRNACFHGLHYPIQACLYLAQRARLYILKAIVDFWMALERGEIEKSIIKIGSHELDFTVAGLSPAQSTAMREFCESKSFALYPVFWQVFLWSWGGFLLKDHLEEEFSLLARETGVPVDEIPLALTAFDKLFPTNSGWFREPANDSRRVLMLMPPVIRGIGAFRRKVLREVEHYEELGFTDLTAEHMNSDHNAAAHILDCPNRELAN